MKKSKKNKIDFCPPAKKNFEIIDRFEREFAKKIGARYCVATSSGYTALFLALWALGIRKGDEVIVPNFTMIATANAVVACGAKPVFAEVDMETGNVNAEHVKEVITNRTRAVIPVHIYGHPCDMDPIMDLARKNNLRVIEDAAEAHGARYKDKYVGTIGDIGCFSFYANKIIQTGEGGAVTTNIRELAEEVRGLRSYYFKKGYFHSKIGWSFRMNPYGAKEGIKQLLTFDKLVNKRREIARFYNENLTDEVVKPIEKPWAKNVYWMYGIKTNHAKELKTYLVDCGVETRDFFVPMYLQDIYEDVVGLADEASFRLMCRGVLLPSMPELTQKELQYIVGCINNFFGGG